MIAYKSTHLQRLARRQPARAPAAHAGTQGIRVCVYRPDGTPWTTIYVSKEKLDDLLAIAENDLSAITHACRFASLKCGPKFTQSNGPWSQVVITDAKKILKAAQNVRAAEAAARLAIENNKAWEQ